MAAAVCCISVVILQCARTASQARSATVSSFGPVLHIMERFQDAIDARLMRGSRDWSVNLREQRGLHVDSYTTEGSSEPSPDHDQPATNTHNLSPERRETHGQISPYHHVPLDGESSSFRLVRLLPTSKDSCLQLEITNVTTSIAPVYKGKPQLCLLVAC